MLRNIRSLPPRKATLLPVRQRYATPVDPSLERIYGGVCLPSPLQRAGYNNVLEVFQEADQASMERFLAEDYWAWHHERGELAFYPPGSRGIEAAITRASEEVILEALNAPDGGPGYSWWLGQSLIYGQDISHKLEVMKARLRKALQYGMGRLNIPEYIHELAHSLKRAAEHEVVGQVKQEEVDEATASIDTHKLNQIGGRTTEAASDSNSETTERSSSGEHHVAGRTRSVTEATGSVLDDFTFAGFDDDADSVHPDNFQDQPMSDSEVDESAITPRVTRSATKNDTREAENAKAEAIASKSTASSSTRNSNPRQVNIEVIVPTRIINSLSSTFLSSSPSSSVPTTTDVASNFDPNEQKLKDRSNVSSTAGKMGNVQSSPSRRVSKNRNKKDRHSQSEEKNQSLSSSSTKAIHDSKNRVAKKTKKAKVPKGGSAKDVNGASAADSTASQTTPRQDSNGLLSAITQSVEGQLQEQSPELEDVASQTWNDTGRSRPRPSLALDSTSPSPATNGISTSHDQDIHMLDADAEDEHDDGTDAFGLGKSWLRRRKDASKSTGKAARQLAEHEGPPQYDVDDLDEDEQLNIAIAMSLAKGSKSPARATKQPRLQQSPEDAGADIDIDEMSEEAQYRLAVSRSLRDRPTAPVTMQSIEQGQELDRHDSYFAWAASGHTYGSAKRFTVPRNYKANHALYPDMPYIASEIRGRLGQGMYQVEEIEYAIEHCKGDPEAAYAFMNAAYGIPEEETNLRPMSEYVLRKPGMTPERIATQAPRRREARDAAFGTQSSAFRPSGEVSGNENNSTAPPQRDLSSTKIADRRSDETADNVASLPSPDDDADGDSRSASAKAKKKQSKQSKQRCKPDDPAISGIIRDGDGDDDQQPPTSRPTSGGHDSKTQGAARSGDSRRASHQNVNSERGGRHQQSRSHFSSTSKQEQDSTSQSTALAVASKTSLEETPQIVASTFLFDPSNARAPVPYAAMDRGVLYRDPNGGFVARSHYGQMYDDFPGNLQQQVRRKLDEEEQWDIRIRGKPMRRTGHESRHHDQQARAAMVGKKHGKDYVPAPVKPPLHYGGPPGNVSVNGTSDIAWQNERLGLPAMAAPHIISPFTEADRTAWREHPSFRSSTPISPVPSIASVSHSELGEFINRGSAGPRKRKRGLYTQDAVGKDANAANATPKKSRPFKPIDTLTRPRPDADDGDVVMADVLPNKVATKVSSTLEEMVSEKGDSAGKKKKTPAKKADASMQENNAKTVEEVTNGISPFSCGKMSVSDNKDHERQAAIVASSTLEPAAGYPYTPPPGMASAESALEPDSTRLPCVCRWGACTQKFPTNKELFEHVSFQHAHEKICSWIDCNTPFRTPFRHASALVMHLHSHIKYQPCVCPCCPAAYTVQWSLLVHLREKHNIDTSTSPIVPGSVPSSRDSSKEKAYTDEPEDGDEGAAASIGGSVLHTSAKGKSMPRSRPRAKSRAMFTDVTRSEIWTEADHSDDVALVSEVSLDVGDHDSDLDIQDDDDGSVQGHHSIENCVVDRTDTDKVQSHATPDVIDPAMDSEKIRYPYEHDHLTSLRDAKKNLSTVTALHESVNPHQKEKRLKKARRTLEKWNKIDQDIKTGVMESWPEASLRIFKKDLSIVQTRVSQLESEGAPEVAMLAMRGKVKYLQKRVLLAQDRLKRSQQVQDNGRNNADDGYDGCADLHGASETTSAGLNDINSTHATVRDEDVEMADPGTGPGHASMDDTSTAASPYPQARAKTAFPDELIPLSLDHAFNPINERKEYNKVRSIFRKAERYARADGGEGADDEMTANVHMWHDLLAEIEAGTRESAAEGYVRQAEQLLECAREARQLSKRDKDGVVTKSAKSQHRLAKGLLQSAQEHLEEREKAKKQGKTQD